MKKETSAGEKPDPVRTHLRNMIIVPEMIGSIIGVYNGKTFNQVKPKRGTNLPMHAMSKEHFAFKLDADSSSQEHQETNVGSMKCISSFEVSISGAETSSS